MESLEGLCRLCGKEDGIKVNIFEPGAERVKKIHKCLPITVNEHDPFPKQICHRCVFNVDQFFEFRTISIKTHEIFKKKVPWLRDKKLPQRNEGERPMVEVTLNSVNAVSPSEKQINQSSGSFYDMCDNAILIEDSPPYVEHSIESNTLVNQYEVDEQQNPTEAKKPKRSKSRSLWDTKKRKKKNRKACKIAEVFTTSKQEYENLNNIENDPLCLSSVDNIENNSFDNIENNSFDNIENNLFDNIVENNSCTVSSPKSELSVVELKGILTDDRGGANIALPKYILTTKIPRVGNVYTCERCGRTFLNPQPASLHSCPGNHAEEDRSKEEQHHNEEVETDTAKDFYQCSECGHVFTRHSQLVSHRKKHTSQVEYSSDDSFKPFKKRRKHHTKRKHKPRLLNTNSTYNSNSTTTNNYDSNSTAANNYDSDSTTRNNYDSSNSTATNHYNSNSTATNHYNSNSTAINHYNSNSTTTNHYNSHSTFEATEPSFIINLDEVEPNITRHSLLSSDSE